jgi:hypothetical protein
MEFVAASVRQREAGVAVPDGGEFVGQIGEMVGDEVDDLALALDAALYAEHAGGQDDGQSLALGRSFAED